MYSDLNPALIGSAPARRHRRLRHLRSGGRMVRFCHNHGLAQITNRPQWYTLVGGARQYVDKIVAGIPDQRLNSPGRRSAFRIVQPTDHGLARPAGLGGRRSSGIGLATAEALIARGASVQVSARGAEALGRLVAQHTRTGVPPPMVQAWPLDVTDAAAVAATARAILAQGPLDLVVYCAGHYSEMRATTFNLAETLYLDLEPLGLGVSVVHPGFVQTPLTAQNTFTMPALITPEQAAAAMLSGWARGDFDIHYPKRFTRWMKLLRLLPYRAYFPAVRRFTGQQTRMHTDLSRAALGRLIPWFESLTPRSLHGPRFVVTQQLVDGAQTFLVWEFPLQRGDTVTEQLIRGGSHLTLDEDGRITDHCDYWDAAEELYEKLPLLGTLMRWLKRKANS